MLPTNLKIFVTDNQSLELYRATNLPVDVIEKFKNKEKSNIIFEEILSTTSNKYVAA